MRAVTESELKDVGGGILPLIIIGAAALVASGCATMPVRGESAGSVTINDVDDEEDEEE